ncbi:hypothetical protein BH789_gp074 [Gordonia phage GMA6]|uniref:Uncharacterized protein n=1 Tax=Gordonia phage GMA6 TaxID=1647285 RepID=A0A0K0NKU3_9CAUD|nr:hypothetical protein BH789_gp074 [Gordonia phage GMA6]AKL88355.1 hypothetical protein GMA6_74 [Gordonia phage GMA6]
MGSAPNHNYDRIILPGNQGMYVLMYSDISQIKIASKQHILLPLSMHGQTQAAPAQGTDVFLRADRYRLDDPYPFRESPDDYVCIRRSEYDALKATLGE